MTNQTNIRELVLGVLLAVTKDGEYSHIALKNTLDKYQYLSKQERGFLTRVVNGTLEHMIWIDYVIDHFSKVKVNKMKPVIRCIIRSSVYELKYMDAIPESATCNEAVKLTARKGFSSLKGFVNGVLRNIARGLEEIPMPQEDTPQGLSVRYSMPQWIIEQWLMEYSKEQVEAMLKGFLQEVPTSIRVNTARTTKEELICKLVAEGVTVKENEELPFGLYITNYDYLNALESFREGLFYVQDVSSMMVSYLAGAEEGAHVIDVCAAPGGKSIHMAELLHHTGMVDARDLTEYKVDLIRENIERCQLKNIKATVADARIFCPQDAETADVVIADLPCSGLGVIGKKPDIKYKMTPEKQQELAKLQREILGVVCSYVKPQGTLMYSTCTINKGENQENVEWFIKEHPQFTLVSQQQILPKEGRNDGFFIAKFIKEQHGKN